MTDSPQYLWLKENFLFVEDEISMLYSITQIFSYNSDQEPGEIYLVPVTPGKSK